MPCFLNIIIIFIIHSIFGLFLKPLNVVDLEVRPSCACQGQESGKEWKQNE